MENKKIEAIKKLAYNIWVEGETPWKQQLLVVSDEFKDEDLELEKQLGEDCVSYTLKWKVKGSIVTIELFKNESYGAGFRVKDLGGFDVEIPNTDNEPENIFIQ